MNEDDEPLTKKDLIEILGELEKLRVDIHDTEIRILKSFHTFSKVNEQRLGHLDHFAATAAKRLADLETSNRLAALEPYVMQIEKKLDRRQ